MDRGDLSLGAGEFDLDTDSASQQRAQDRAVGHASSGPPLRPLSGAWPDSSPTWLRGPAFVAVTVVVAALLGGALANHQQRAVAANAVAVERGLGAVSISDVELSTVQYADNGASVTGDDGRPNLMVDMTLTNTSDTSLAVTLTGIEIGGMDEPLTLVGTPGRRQLTPLDPESFQLLAKVDCTSVPAEVLVDASSTIDWVNATAMVNGVEQAVRWGAGSRRGGLGQRLAYLCRPS